MYRFKGFDSAQCGDSMSALEAMVNAWMEGERPRIRYVCQTMRGDHILLSFVYEDSRDLERRASVQAQASTAFPHIFDEEYVEERPTSSRIPIPPPSIH